MRNVILLTICIVFVFRQFCQFSFFLILSFVIEINVKGAICSDKRRAKVLDVIMLNRLTSGSCTWASAGWGTGGGQWGQMPPP